MKKTLKERLAAKKLALARETVRAISESDLKDIVGGTNTTDGILKHPL